jgi:hypothetical protein
MTGAHKFAVLKKLNEKQVSQCRSDMQTDVDQSLADRENFEQHIKNKVMPLFKEVTQAASNNRYYRIAEIIVEQPMTGTEEIHPPFVMGTLLALSHNRRA